MYIYILNINIKSQKMNFKNTTELLIMYFNWMEYF